LKNNFEHILFVDIPDSERQHSANSVIFFYYETV